jgi:hypothetical protein
MGILEDVSLSTRTSYALESQKSLSGLHPIEFEHQAKAQEAVAIKNKGAFVSAGAS